MSEAINEASQYFPVITLTGPRQSGKSTLLRHLFPSLPYMSMENPDIRSEAKMDPKGFLATFTNGVIIDEVQHVPDLLSYIQGIVDESPDRKFYLTGSSQFSFLKKKMTISTGCFITDSILRYGAGKICRICYTPIT